MIITRIDGSIVWEGSADSLADAVRQALAAGLSLAGADLEYAVLVGADLRDANLADADLRGADLADADLRGADLAGADLTEADLRDADLVRANLVGAKLKAAVLREADLTGADLGGANLADADLREADLRDADLRDADLRAADLRGANLTSYRDDVWAVLRAAPTEADAVLRALREGRVDGSTYAGDCACLVGTIARARGCPYDEIPHLRPNPDRPAEVWFAGIRPGDTPETNIYARYAAEWVETWIATMRADVLADARSMHD